MTSLECQWERLTDEEDAVREQIRERLGKVLYALNNENYWGLRLALLEEKMEEVFVDELDDLRRIQGKKENIPKPDDHTEHGVKREDF